MFKQFFFAAFLLLARSFVFGQISNEDYKVYSAVIKTEITDSIKSIAIIKFGIDSQEASENMEIAADILSSKDLRYTEIENYKRERSSIIDSNSIELLLDYCKTKADKFVLKNNFNQTFKTILIKKFPIRRKSIQQDWKSFYDKYPGSGGIYSFSKIKYYTEDKRTAIVYYWVKRAGLSGHGVLALLTKANGEWQMKYKTYLWMN